MADCPVRQSSSSPLGGAFGLFSGASLYMGLSPVQRELNPNGGPLAGPRRLGACVRSGMRVQRMADPTPPTHAPFAHPATLPQGSGILNGPITASRELDD